MRRQPAVVTSLCILQERGSNKQRCYHNKFPIHFGQIWNECLSVCGSAVVLACIWFCMAHNTRLDCLVMDILANDAPEDAIPKSVHPESSQKSEQVDCVWM